MDGSQIRDFARPPDERPAAFAFGANGKAKNLQKRELSLANPRRIG
jgi:hypothetical protein